MPESVDANSQIIQRSSRLLDYLSAVAREVGPAPLRDVMDQDYIFRPEAIPIHPGVLLGTSGGREAWLTVRKVPKPAPPKLPEPLSALTSEASIDSPDATPTLVSHRVTAYLDAELQRVKVQVRKEIEAELDQEATDALDAPGHGTTVVGSPENAPPVEPTDDLSPEQVGVDREQELQTRLELRLKEFRQATYENLRKNFEDWRSTNWAEWAEKNRPAFQARALYSHLFEMHLLLEGEKATLEARWGHFVFSWRSEGGDVVRAPLANATVNIEVDGGDGSIRVTPDGPLEIDFSSIEGIGLAGLEHLYLLQDHYKNEPIDVWSPEERHAIREQLVAPLGLNARTVNSDKILAPTDAPQINDGWVLTERKRPLRQEAFYGQLSKKIAESGEAPSALASIVTDNDTVDRAMQTRGTELVLNDGTADRMLMPLPANDDQERIARQIATARGVTVQGPPGTGKSHTIVNLLSHLVAQGKRVLITAENEQALAVVREKIPAELRDLSIAVLGSTPAALDELRNSAQSMRDSLSQVDVQRDQALLNDLGTQIDRAREDARRLDLQLVEALRSEQRELTLDGEQLRAPDVALWLAQRHNLVYIPDRPGIEQPVPLTPDELRELKELASSIEQSDAEHSLRELPVTDWLWRPMELRARIEEENTLASELTDLSASGLRLDQLSTCSEADLVTLTGQCKARQEELAELEGTWETRLAGEIRGNTPVFVWLLDRLPQIDAGLDELERIQGYLSGKEIVVPESDPNLLLSQLHGIRDRFESGKKLPAFGARELKDLLAATTVNGYSPSRAEQINDVIWKVHAIQQQRTIQRLQAEVYATFGAPVPAENAMSALASRSVQDRIRRLIAFWGERATALNARLETLTDRPRPAMTLDSLRQVQDLLERAAKSLRAQSLAAEFAEQQARIREMSRRSGSSSLWTELEHALADRDLERWSRIESEARRLNDLRASVVRREALVTQLRAGGAPVWARQILESAGASSVVHDEHSLAEAWTVAQTQGWIDELHAKADIETLMSSSHEISKDLEQLVISYAKTSARLSLSQRMKDKERRALETWLTAIRRVGRGTGKNAPRFKAQARAALPAAMGAVPVWIMPIYRVMENFDPLVSEMFDVVIVDESSQCDLLSLGVLALGHKVVVVGDDKQTSPVMVGVNTDRISELQNQYVRDFPDKSLLTIDESLYAISARAFPSTILLREHFRCVPEIIRFSNRFYGNQILPLREVTVPQIGDPLRVVHVEGAVSLRDRGSRTNRAEAERLVEEVVRCASDPAYDGLTFGVVSMMSGPQKDILEGLLMERLGIDEFEKRRLRVGNPPNFQGDERNVIFISFVADDNSFAATKERDSQWANVAASRAQDQLWLFHSMDPPTLNANDLRRALIEYASGSGREETDALLAQTESKFEADVLNAILDRGYRVVPQYQVGSYRIDLVVQFPGGERLAVECDGDRFHGPEHWESDVRRQRVLERLGWNFWRVRASTYYLDPKAALEPLWLRLAAIEERVREREEARERQLLLAARASMREGELDSSGQPALADEKSERDWGIENGDDEASRERTSIEAVHDHEGEYAGVSASAKSDTSDPHLTSELPDLRTNAPADGIDHKSRATVPEQGIPGIAAAPLPIVAGIALAMSSQAPEASTASVRPHNLNSSLQDGEELEAALEAWRAGERYRLRRDNTIEHVATGLPIGSLISPEIERKVLALMLEARPEGGLFKLGDDGTIVTLINRKMIRVGQVELL